MPAAAAPVSGGEVAARILADLRARDPAGDRVHIAAAVLFMACLPLAPAPSAIAFAVLATVSAIRAPRTMPAYRVLLRDPVGWLLIAWTALTALSLLWTRNAAQGGAELGAFRMVTTGILLWPLFNRLPLLITAFLAGVLIQNGIQAAQGLGLLERIPGDAHRLRGLVHPIMTGTMCLTAVCWHASAWLHAPGDRRRFIWLAGGALALLGLLLTGSRGPWIAAAVALPLLLATASRRSPLLRRRAVTVAVLGLLLPLVAWPVAGDVLTQRLDLVRQDIARISSGDLSGDIGFRIASWTAGAEILRERPLTGTGAGGFHEAALTTSRGDVIAGMDAHAHSLYVQAAATTGIGGAIIVLALAGTGLVRAWRNRADHLFADGTFAAMVAWWVAAAFDAYQLNGQTLGLGVLLLAAVHPARPLLGGEAGSPAPSAGR